MKVLEGYMVTHFGHTVCSVVNGVCVAVCCVSSSALLWDDMRCCTGLCVAVQCRTVILGGAVWSGVLQCATWCYSVLQCDAVCCNVLQCDAVCYSVLQYAAV